MGFLRGCVAALFLCVSLWTSLWVQDARAQPIQSMVAAEPSAVHWTYQDDTGPDHWGELDTTFAICASGQAQSPINLTAAEGADLIDPDFHYEPVPLNLLNNGHTVQIPYAPGIYITLDGVRYNLLQFHFHSPSEHTVEGQAQDAELHLVHQSDAGELAVVAVMLHAEDGSFIEIENTETENTETENAYQKLSQNLPLNDGDNARTDDNINARALLPEHTTTYRYSGSLTTPPCSETVTWLVMTEPVNISNAQASKYASLLNHNNRPLQLLNQRTVQVDTSQ